MAPIKKGVGKLVFGEEEVEVVAKTSQADRK
jgi:hypothetical protein